MNKDVLNKLAKIESKVELAEVRVDLALVDDLKKADQQVIARTNEFRDQINNAEQYINQARDSKDAAQKAFEDYSSVVLKFRQATKDLGMDYPYEADYKALQTIMVNLSSKYLKVIGNK